MYQSETAIRFKKETDGLRNNAWCEISPHSKIRSRRAPMYSPPHLGRGVTDALRWSRILVLLSTRPPTSGEGVGRKRLKAYRRNIGIALRFNRGYRLKSPSRSSIPVNRSPIRKLIGGIPTQFVSFRFFLSRDGGLPMESLP